MEYSTAAGLYCTMHDVKVPFCMSDFSIIKIIENCFHIDNNKSELVIGYDMIIERDMMVQLSLSDYFKRQVLQWDGLTVPVK